MQPQLKSGLNIQGDIVIRKEIFHDMITNFGKLLDDFEMIAEQETMKEVDKRLKEIKEGKVKGLTEQDFEKYKEKRLSKVNA